jgi:uncharacterized protein YecE (DUF72 family)
MCKEVRDNCAHLHKRRAAIRLLFVRFNVNVPEAELTELRRRINATKWSEQETFTYVSQCVQLATIQAVACYWASVKSRGEGVFLVALDALMLTAPRRFDRERSLR